MKKRHSFGKSAIPALLVTMLIGATLGCPGGPQEDGAALQSVAITSPPDKTVYAIGEALNLAGLVVTGTYADGTTRTETVSLSNVSGYNANATGQQTLTVTVNGKTAAFTVTVNSGALVSIAVTAPPSKTVYTLGEALSLTGLVVTGTYSDGSTKTETVSLSNISGYNANTLGQQTLTVTISGKTATFTVTVNGAALVSIAVTALPSKTVYAKGENLDIAGLVVTGTYSDNSTKTESVSLSTISGYDANTLGQQTLTVTVGGETATFTVAVNAAALVSIVVTTPPDKTAYAKGEALDITGLAVAGTYTDGSTKTESVSLSDIAGYNANSLGQQTLTVTIGGKTADFTVSVKVQQPVAVNLEDPINGTPDDIILSKTGIPDSISLEIDGAYASYAWFLNDAETPVSTSADCTLNAADCPLGRNYLTVEARTSGGAYHSKEITFAVIK
jgi:hypothetical protein